MQTFKMTLATFFILAITFTAKSQNIGINTTTPAYPLDVNGRMRLQYKGETAGLWFNNSANIETAFIGMYNDTISGLYGNNNWRIGMDAKNARLGIGTMLPTVPLSFPSILGKKISLYHGTTGDAGFDVFGNELRIHSDYANAATTFGYDDYTNGFTEKMRLTGSGNLGIGTNNPTANLDVAGTVKITDGTQGDGKVLTSDANGNASWKSQAYGNTERFMYRLYLTSANTPNAALTTDYNFGTTTVSQEGIGNGLDIRFPKAGLYHLEISSTVQTDGDYSSSGSSKILKLQVDNYINGVTGSRLYNQSYAAYEYYQSAGYSQVSINKSMDVYVPANNSIRFFLTAYKTTNYEQRITVIGNLISE